MLETDLDAQDTQVGDRFERTLYPELGFIYICTFLELVSRCFCCIEHCVCVPQSTTCLVPIDKELTGAEKEKSDDSAKLIHRRRTVILLCSTCSHGKIPIGMPEYRVHSRCRST